MTNAICGCYDEKYSHDDYRYNRIKEQLSISYLNAIASYLGSELQVHGPLIDDDGIDVTIRPPQSRFLDCTNTKPSIDVQMKCTSSPRYDSSGDSMLFNLDRRIFTKMQIESLSPTLLLVLILPEEVDEWISCNDSGLLMQREMLWYSANGCGRTVSDNQKTVNISIPCSNKVTKESVGQMLHKVARMEAIVNEV